MDRRDKTEYFMEEKKKYYIPPLPERSAEEDEKYMRMAMDEAMLAASEDEVPVGAVLVREGRVIARCHNRREATKCATHHAEILAIEEGCSALGGWRLTGATLYVTMEPCPMCAGAIINSRIPRVVYGAPDLRFGAMGSLFDLTKLPLNHKPIVDSGVLDEENRKILADYFAAKRRAVKNDGEE